MPSMVGLCAIAKFGGGKLDDGAVYRMKRRNSGQGKEASAAVYLLKIPSVAMYLIYLYL
jgi:hypothetical protein